MKRFSAFITALFLFSGLHAQKSWTLEECIQQALSGNIRIKQQELNTRLSAIQYRQSISSLFPSLNGSASHVYNYGQTLDLYTNEFATDRVRSNNFYLSSGVTLFSGFQLLNNIRQKHADFLAATYDTEKMKNDISLAVATAYLQVLYNTELLSIAQNQSALTAQQLEITAKLVDAGTLPQLNLYTMQAQYASEELQTVNASNMLDLSLLTLTQLMELQNTEGFSVVKPMVDVPESSALALTVDEIYRKALLVQPDIKGAEMRLKSSEKGLYAARGSISPVITLNGSWGTGYSGASRIVDEVMLSGNMPIGYTALGEIVYAPSYSYTYKVKSFSDQIRQNENKSIGVYVNIPIFNRLQSRNAIAGARIGVDMAGYNLTESKNQLYKNIQQARADAVAALNKFRAAEKSLTAFTESFNYTRQRFDAGMLNAVDFNDAKNKMTAASSELLQAKYEYVFRIKVLDFYQGKPLTLN